MSVGNSNNQQVEGEIRISAGNNQQGEGDSSWENRGAGNIGVPLESVGSF